MAAKLVSVLSAAHGDAFELLELAEEVFDQVPPFVHLLVDAAGAARGADAAR